MDWLSHEVIAGLVGSAMASQVFQFGAAFSIAAFIHAGRMKKEIASQMGHISDAVNNLASALRQDLSAQAKRIESVESRVQDLEKL